MWHGPRSTHGWGIAVDPLCPPDLIYGINPNHIITEGDGMSYIADSYDKITDQFCQTLSAQGGYRWVRFHPHGRPRTRLYDDVIPRSQYEAELLLNRPVELIKDDLIKTLEKQLGDADAIINALDEALRTALNTLGDDLVFVDGEYAIFDDYGYAVPLDDRIKATIACCLTNG